MGGENNDFSFQSHFVYFNNENTSGKHFVSLSQEILPFGREGGSPASSDLSRLTHICHPKQSQGTHGNHDGKSKGQILRLDPEKCPEGGAGCGCSANGAFGKHSEEQQIIQNGLHLLAVLRQGKQP